MAIPRDTVAMSNHYSSFVALLYLFVLPLGLVAQENSRMDSLRQAYGEAQSDSSRGFVALAWSEAFADNQLDSTIHYTQIALQQFEAASHLIGQIRAHNRLRAMYWRTLEYSKVEFHLQALLRLNQNEKRTKEAANCWLRLSALHSAEHKFAIALSDILHAQELFKTVKDTFGIAHTFFAIGMLQFNKEEFEPAISNLQQSATLMHQIKRYQIEGEVLSNLGNTYRIMGDYKQARDRFLNAIELLEKGKGGPSLARAYNSLGIVYSKQGEYKLSIEFYQKALEEANRVQALDLQAEVLNNLGMQHVLFFQYSKALEYHHLALKAAINSQNRPTEGQTLHNLGHVHDLLGNPDSSLYWAHKAMAVKKELGNERDLISTMLLLSNSMLHTVPDEAFAKLDTALFLAKKTNMLQKQGSVFLAIGKAYIEQKSYLKAINFLDSAYTIFSAEKATPDLVEVWEARSKLYIDSGDFKQATLALKQKEALNDSMFSSESKERLAQLQARYWTEKQQHELDLAKQNEEIQRLESEQLLADKHQSENQRNLALISMVVLAIMGGIIYRLNYLRKRNQTLRQLGEKELRAIRSQLNPHFLFNSLSAIQNLINKSETRSANIYLARFARLMRHVLENSDKPLNSLEDELITLELYIELEALRFDFEYSIVLNEDFAKGDTYVPTLLLQPYVENAIIHGLAPKSADRKLLIDIHHSDDGVRIAVEDNGVGRNFHPTDEPSPERKHRSMGLELNRERLRAFGDIYGEIQEPKVFDLLDDQQQPRGTRIELKLPVCWATSKDPLTDSIPDFSS